jgi:hypothetical protein
VHGPFNVIDPALFRDSQLGSWSVRGSSTNINLLNHLVPLMADMDVHSLEGGVIPLVF